MPDPIPDPPTTPAGSDHPPAGGSVRDAHEAAPVVPGLTLLRLRGRGSTATVYAARRDLDGWACAVKVTATADRDQARREIDVLTAVRAPGLVRLHDVVATRDGRLALVLDLVDGGVLRAIIADRGRLVPREAIGVLRVVVRALAALHAQGIAHGDLSAANVLITRDGRAVLGDLGSARLRGERRWHVRGTTGFVAPEVELGAHPGPASDMYGVGALAWLMLTGAVPGTAYGRTPAEEALRGCPAGLVDLVAACLTGDPAGRPTAAEAAARCADLGPEEPLGLPDGPLGLPDGPDLGGRLTHRIRGDHEEPPGERGAVVDVGGDVVGDVDDDVRAALALLNGEVGDGGPLSRVGAPRGHPGAGDGPRGRHRGGDPGRGSRFAARCGRAVTGVAGRVVGAMLLGVVVGLGALAGVAVWRGDGLPFTVSLPVSLPAPHAAPEQTLAMATSESAPSPAAPSSPAPTSAPSAATTPPSTTSEGSSPTAALPRLLAERARAYATADPVPLDDVYAPGTAGLAAARADVADLRRAGRRYDGLGYDVSAARELPRTTRDGVPEARVRALVTSSAFRVAPLAPVADGGAIPTIPTIPTTVPAPESTAGSPAQELTYVLRWTDAGWRLSAIES